MDENVINIEEFLFSPDFKRMVDYSGKFNLFNTLGISTSEIHHSRVLKFLFDPAESHGCGGGFLRSFLREAIAGAPPEQKSKFLHFLVGVDFRNARVLTEQGRHGIGYIDLIVEFPGQKVVIGIENKIFADERAGQIKDYQDLLNERYSGFHQKAVIFLTPEGREASTADPSSDVVLINTSYRTVIEAVLLEKESVSEQTRDFVEQFEKHLEETIVGSSEIRDLAMGIWKNPQYAKALKTLIDFRPYIDDGMRDNFKRKIDEYVRERKNDTTSVNYHSPGGFRREVKITLSSWNGKRLPFTLMFYLYDADDGSWVPSVQLVIWREYFGKEEYGPSLEAFARDNPNDILADYPEIDGWRVWGKVFVDHGDPVKLSKEGDIADAAAKAAIGLLERIHPLVEQFNATGVK
jgi:hypothetical protein